MQKIDLLVYGVPYIKNTNIHLKQSHICGEVRTQTIKEEPLGFENFFNGSKLGIYYFQVSRNIHEEICLDIAFYNTDYKTHKAKRKEFLQKNIKINKDNFLDYTEYLTSFGINIFVIVNGPNGKEIILGKNKEIIYPTASEGFIAEDTNEFGELNILSCIKRAMFEELGLNSQDFEKAISVNIYDFFLVKSVGELGVSVVYETNSFEFKPSKDGLYEGIELLSIPLSDIDTFIAENDFKPFVLDILELVLKRYSY
jgi:hypothetical protein